MQTFLNTWMEALSARAEFAGFQKQTRNIFIIAVQFSCHCVDVFDTVHSCGLKTPCERAIMGKLILCRRLNQDWFCICVLAFRSGISYVNVQFHVRLFN